MARVSWIVVVALGVLAVAPLTFFNRDVVLDRTVIVLSNRGDLDTSIFVAAVDQALTPAPR